MKIWIKNTDGIGENTEVNHLAGDPVEVTAIDIRIRMKEIVSANLQFALPGIDTVAEVTISKEHLKELAAAHGFGLVAKP